ncbi:COG4223 family protein [Zavarzinia sp.]|uniref:COG4223 family protein n=1 Tax=Zavarzinia sp. TaxID=2027920 RepID=UPI00356316E3
MTERPDQPDPNADLPAEPAAVPERPDLTIEDKPLEDPPPAIDPAYDVSQSSPGRGFKRTLWAGVAAVVLIGAGAFLWHRYGDTFDGFATATSAPAAAPTNTEARLNSLEKAEAALERKLLALEARVAELPDKGVDPAALDDIRSEIAALRERQGALEENLAAADGGTDTEPPLDAPAPAPVAPTSPIADAALSARVAALEAKLAQAPAGADPAKLATLEREIAALKAAGAEADSRIAAETDRLRAVGRGVSLVYGIGRLRNDLATEAPYAPALATVRGHFEALGLLREPTIGKALETLAVHADKGLPTTASLAARFAPLARAAVQAAAVPADGSVVDRLLAEAGNLVTVRPVGDVEGDDVAARVARAEERLGRGDLAGALAEVTKLNGPAADVLGAWRADAEARIAAESAVDLLDGEVAARFAEAN